MRQHYIKVIFLSLFAGACSFYTQPDVRPATSLHVHDTSSEKDHSLRQLAVQFEAITTSASPGMHLSHSQESGYETTYPAFLTDGSIVTSKQLAAMDKPSVVTQHNRPLFGKSGLAVRITTSGSAPIVKFLSRCSSLNFETSKTSPHKSGVACGNSRFTYGWDADGLKIKKNNRTVYDVNLAPGLYRLDGEVMRVE
ncbi:MAG: hypothetical protein AAGA88_10540 [Pseudomonadota bacterium]